MVRSTSPSEVFRRRLLEQRERLGLTQSQLADKAKLPTGSISHFETGERKPSFENLVKLAEALSVSTDFLLGRESDAKPAGEEVMALFRDVGNATEADREFIRDILKARRARKDS